MFEIYLFINPLDGHCLQSEKRFFDMVSKEKPHTRIHLRVIPILNPKVIQTYLEETGMPTNDLTLRNELFQTIYSACLDYKAVQLQGKKIGHQFLFALQESVGQRNESYSTGLVMDILAAINADIPTFLTDRKSDLIVDFFKLDQQIANEMGVEQYSKAAIFNYQDNDDCGFLIDSETPSIFIEDLFRTSPYDSKNSDWEQCIKH